MPTNKGEKENKYGDAFFFLLYQKKKKTAITDKHCLQNVLILAAGDDAIPVFDHSPEAIFQIYLHYKTV